MIWMTTMTTGKTNTINFAGIDYSTTSPSICIKVEDNYDVHFLTQKKTLAEEYWHEPFLFFGRYLPELQGIERYTFICKWAMDVIASYDVQCVFMEDYAFGAQGRVFNIGENTGILKQSLYRRDIPYYTIPPTVIKKYATGKGTANKKKMLDNFLTYTGVDVQQVMNYAGDNPISDIVDSFYILEWGLNNLDEVDCPIIQERFNDKEYTAA